MAHVLLACEISADESTRRKELRRAFREQLRDYSWVKALRDVYVVKLGSVEDRRTLKARLLDLARSEVGVRFIMTPAIGKGTYGGWLPKERWPEIRVQTGHPSQEQEGHEDRADGGEEVSVTATNGTGSKSALALLSVVLGGIALKVTLKKREQRSKKPRWMRSPHFW